MHCLDCLPMLPFWPEPGHQMLPPSGQRQKRLQALACHETTSMAFNNTGVPYKLCVWVHSPSASVAALTPPAPCLGGTHLCHALRLCMRLPNVWCSRLVVGKGVVGEGVVVVVLDGCLQGPLQARCLSAGVHAKPAFRILVQEHPLTALPCSLAQPAHRAKEGHAAFWPGLHDCW